MVQINKKSLSDQIYDILKMEILKGEISFGEILVNRNLQKRFRVSSSPIRDAINRLYQDGLIISIEKTGARVVDFDYEFFVEINEILLCIANTGVKLTSEKADIDEVIRDLEKYLDLQETNIGTDKFYDYDYKFHKTFINYSNNNMLNKLFKEYNVLHEMLVRSFYGPKTLQIQEGSIDNHKRIIQALRNRNYTLAMELTEEHYKRAEEIFKKIFEGKKDEYRPKETI